MTDFKKAFHKLWIFLIIISSFLSCSDDEQFIDFANNMGDSVKVPINAEISPIYNFPVGYEYFKADEYVDQLDQRVRNIMLADKNLDTGNVFRLIYTGQNVNYNVPFVPGLDQGFNLLDFTDMDFSQLETFMSNITNIWVKFSFTNTLPFNIGIDVMMVGTEGVLGELNREPLEVAPAKSQNVNKYSATTSRDSIKLNKDQINELIQTKSILYVAYMSPGWPETYERVLLDTSNFLILQMAVDVEANYKISELILND